MKPKKKKAVADSGYRSIKIKEEHYDLVKDNKEKTGVNIDFFVGQAIVEKLEKEKK